MMVGSGSLRCAAEAHPALKDTSAIAFMRCMEARLDVTHVKSASSCSCHVMQGPLSPGHAHSVKRLISHLVPSQLLLQLQVLG